MKRIISIIFRKIEKWVGYTLINIEKQRQQREHRLSIENFFDLYFSQVDTEDFFFVQIGANDGKNNDPIHRYVTKYKLHGLAIEPQPDVFTLLQETYKPYPFVECVNLAIAHESGTLPFYSVKESFKTSENFSQVSGLATFQKNVLIRTIVRKIPHDANPEEYVQETPVKTSSFKNLVEKYSLKRIDMIQIDCEGYDYEILKMIDLEHFAPSIINLESVHLVESDRIACEKLLESKGYTWFRHGIDMCAYKV